MWYLAVLTAYLLYLLFPPVDNGPFLGWRLYVFGAIGLLLGVLVQRKRLPVDDITLTVFTFFTTFIIYGGLMNICAMVTAASIPGGNEISWDTMKLLYISGVPYDAAHAGSMAIFNFIFGIKSSGNGANQVEIRNLSVRSGCMTVFITGGAKMGNPLSLCNVR